MVRAIVTKSGESYALRVPKRYVKDNHLRLGDVVTIEEPLILQRNAVAALVRHGRERESAKISPNPVAWQQRASGPPKKAGRGSAR